MKIRINAFRRTKSIELETAKITLIAAKNESGKTSLLQGIAAAVTGVLIPLFKLTQKQIINLIHTGQPKASSMVETDSGLVGVNYNADGAERISEGEPLEISVWSSGLKNVLDESDKVRYDTVSQIIKALPSKSLLFEELNKVGCTEEVNNKIWDTISVSGWDAAHDSAKKKGQTLKVKWETVTGRQYGKKIAENWCPDAWDFDLTDSKIEDLKKTLAEEKEWLEIAITSETIDSIDKSKIEDAEKRLNELTSSLDLKNNELTKSQKDYRATRDVMNRINKQFEIVIQKCPNCAVELTIDGNNLIKPVESVNVDQMKQNKKDYNDIEKALNGIEIMGKRIQSEIIDIKAEIKSCETIIKNGISSKKFNKKPKAATEDCRILVEKAEERLNAFTSKIEADNIRNSIVSNQQIIDILSPKGIRLSTLTDKMKKFNSNLKKICEISGWGEMRMNDNTTVTHRGWEYPYFISSSARWRVKTAIQICLAMANNDKLILIDDAEILDSDHKNGLFKLLLQMPFDSIVAMTLQSKDKMPDMEKIGCKGYWIEDGKVV